MTLRTVGGLGAATLLVAVLSCSNRKTPVVGTICVFNSDCDSNLLCTYGKCHEACHANGDCLGDGLCVYEHTTAADGDVPISEPGPGTPKVCIQESCAMNSECPDYLICGRDLRCRQACAANRDCPSPNQLCVVGDDSGHKVCAEAKDIGDNGQLAPGDGGVATPDGGAGPDAAGGAGGSAGAAGGGGAGGAGGSAGAAGAASGGAIAAGGAGGIAGALGGASGGAAVVPEREPNDDKSRPTPYAVGTEVAGTLGAGDGGTDLTDYYEVVAPTTDPSGGYFQASVTNVGDGVVLAEVYSPTDNGRLLLADGADAGQSTSVYWAARPGAHYLVRLYEGGGVAPTFDYSFKVTYTPIDDPHEPNDSSDAPAPLALGVPVSAYFFAGFSSSAVPVPDQDWYAVTLADGATGVHIQSVPRDLRMQFVVYDTNFVQVATANFVGANAGAGLDGSFTAKAGTYLIGIQAFGFNAGSVAGWGTTLPDSFSRPYTLTVTQP